MHAQSDHPLSRSTSPVTMLTNWAFAHRFWLAVVIAPTLLVAAYYYFVAADQYESESHFLVRSADGSATASVGIGQLLGIGSGGVSPSRDAASVADYLTSHDAVAALQAKLNLVGIYQRPEADPWSRLWNSYRAPERLLAYYHGKVDVDFDVDTGIATLRVRAFRPQDAFNISNALLALGESRVNTLNKRAYDSTLGLAQRQLASAESDVDKMQSQVTSFRTQNGVINPQTSGQARVTLVTSLQENLAEARAQLTAMNSALSPNSPQVVAARARVQALSQQVALEQSRLASGQSNVATGMGVYESLQLKQEFAGKRYDAAAAGLEKAREQMIKQQLFVVRVVDPNYPVKALYPKRIKIVITTFFVLLLVYAIGWLIAAGMKEHAA